MSYNKYINNFANNAEYEAYINGSVAEVPNTALIDDTGKMIYTKILPNNYVMFGTTTGTQDFKIGSTSVTSKADCIQIHVAVEDESGVNKMYVSPEDVLKIPKYFYSSYNGFGSTEGKKILSIKKWKIDTSKVTNMESMFLGSTSLTSLDLSSFDTSQVTSMDGMFDSCSSLTSLELSSFNTSKVTSMSSMFNMCSSLTSIDLSSFDTSQVTSFNRMFYFCTSLTSLDLSSFVSNKITNMSYMFHNCSKLNKLYLSSGFFNSTSLNTYEFPYLSSWTDAESLAMFVESIIAHNGTGKRVQLSSETKNALTSEQKTAITNAGWTIA